MNNSTRVENGLQSGFHYMILFRKTVNETVEIGKNLQNRVQVYWTAYIYANKEVWIENIKAQTLEGNKDFIPLAGEVPVVDIIVKVDDAKTKTVVEIE